MLIEENQDNSRAQYNFYTERNHDVRYIEHYRMRKLYTAALSMGLCIWKLYLYTISDNELGNLALYKQSKYV